MISRAVSHLVHRRIELHSQLAAHGKFATHDCFPWFVTLAPCLMADTFREWIATSDRIVEKPASHKTTSPFCWTDDRGPESLDMSWTAVCRYSIWRWPMK